MLPQKACDLIGKAFKHVGVCFPPGRVNSHDVCRTWEHRDVAEQRLCNFICTETRTIFDLTCQEYA